MTTSTPRYNYVEWLSAEEMHEASKNWLSELQFILDEQLFLNNLVTSYTLQLIDKDVLEQSKKIVEQLQQSEKTRASLFKKVQDHGKKFEIIVDDVDQLQMEKAYRATHKVLLRSMNEYAESYKEVKEKLFKLVSTLMKKERHKRLLK